MNEKFIITIARQYGSGGKTIGQMLAKRLGIPCYNREIITMASEDSGINAVLFSDERLKPDLLSRLRSRYQSRGGKPVSPEESGFTNEDNLFEYQAKIIRQLADEGPCVMIGRCADFVLRERKDVARVFVHAPDDFCLQEALKVDSLPVRAVKKKIGEVDAYRAAYYRHYTGQEWKDARNYDLSLNSAVLGFEGTVEMIVRYLETRAQFQPD